MDELRKLLDKFETTSDQLRTRTAFEAAALQIRQLQRQLSISLQKSAELHAHVKLLQEHLLATRAELKSEKNMRRIESDLAFSRLQELEEKVKEVELNETLGSQSAPVNSVLQQILSKLATQANGGSSPNSSGAELLLDFLASNTEGSISLAELEEALTAFMPEPVSPADYDALVEVFKNLDTAGEGMIDLKHIAAAFTDPAVVSLLSFVRTDSGSEDDSNGGGQRARSRPAGTRASSAGKASSETSTRLRSPDSEIAQLREQLDAANKKHRREKAEWEKKRKELQSKADGNDAKPEVGPNSCLCVP
jgi:hypothetical protein